MYNMQYKYVSLMITAGIKQKNTLVLYHQQNLKKMAQRFTAETIMAK